VIENLNWSATSFGVDLKEIWIIDFVKFDKSKGKFFQKFGEKHQNTIGVFAWVCFACALISFAPNYIVAFMHIVSKIMMV